MAAKQERLTRQSDLSSILAAVLSNVPLDVWPRIIARAIVYTATIHGHPSPSHLYLVLATQLIMESEAV
jgi:hypothetical protein